MSFNKGLRFRVYAIGLIWYIFFCPEHADFTMNGDVFLKGPYLWKGFRGSAQLSNESFKELDDILNGHVDAAFRMHNPDNPDDHDHIYFFMVLLGAFIVLLTLARFKSKTES